VVKSSKKKQKNQLESENIILESKKPTSTLSLTDIVSLNLAHNYKINYDNIVLLILNCKKYDYKRQTQIKDWIQKIQIRNWFHIQGDLDLEDDYHINMEEHLITIKISDDYISLPKKVYLAFEIILNRFPETTYILKTDDDMNCNIEYFDRVLYLIKDYDYGGFLINIEKDDMSNYHFKRCDDRNLRINRKSLMANGRFYFLSRKSINYLLENKDIFYNSTYEDNTVGYVLSNKYDITILSLPMITLFEEYEHELDNEERLIR
jgi:hypothetical protein